MGVAVAGVAAAAVTASVFMSRANVRVCVGSSWCHSSPHLNPPATASLQPTPSLPPPPPPPPPARAQHSRDCCLACPSLLPTQSAAAAAAAVSLSQQQQQGCWLLYPSLQVPTPSSLLLHLLQRPLLIHTLVAACSAVSATCHPSRVHAILDCLPSARLSVLSLLLITSSSHPRIAARFPLPLLPTGSHWAPLSPTQSVAGRGRGQEPSSKGDLERASRQQERASRQQERGDK